jgi:hypothetical protein
MNSENRKENQMKNILLALFVLGVLCVTAEAAGPRIVVVDRDVAVTTGQVTATVVTRVPSKVLVVEKGKVVDKEVVVPRRDVPKAERPVVRYHVFGWPKWRP